MTDPRFFRRYLDIIAEEPASATANVGDNSSFTVDKSTKTVTGTTDVAGTKVTAKQDLSPGGASSVSASRQVAPNLTATVTQSSPAYNKGQLAGTSQVQTSYKDTAGALGTPGQTHNVRVDKGVGFGGAGKNIQPGQNIQTTYTKS
jgi:hypothetical protein